MPFFSSSISIFTNNSCFNRSWFNSIESTRQCSAHLPSHSFNEWHNISTHTVAKTSHTHTLQRLSRLNNFHFVYTLHWNFALYKTDDKNWLENLHAALTLWHHFAHLVAHCPFIVTLIRFAFFCTEFISICVFVFSLSFHFSNCKLLRIN